MTAAAAAIARPASGIAWIVATAAFFAGSDTLIKVMGAIAPVLLLLWVRYAFQAGAMALWLAPRGRAAFACAHPKFQWMRGALLLATSAMSFFGLQHMPVAEFTALGMLTPVIVTMLVAWVLKEDVSPLRWALVCGGFLGAVIVIRPGAGVFGWAAVFPLLMALCYGAFQVLTSRLASLESPYTTHFYTGFSGAVLVTPLLFVDGAAIVDALRVATPAQIGGMLAIGVCATVGHLCLIFAFGTAPMATLMPFTYAQIAWALILSWLVFRHMPDGWAWVGMLVIAACGAASAWLNVRHPQSVVEADTVSD